MPEPSSDQQQLSEIMKKEYASIEPAPQFSQDFIATLSQTIRDALTPPAAVKARWARSVPSLRPLYVGVIVVVVVSVLGIVFSRVDYNKEPIGARPASSPTYSAESGSGLATPAAPVATPGLTKDSLIPSMPTVVRLSEMPTYKPVRGAAPADSVSMPWRLAEIDKTRKILTIYFATGDGFCTKLNKVFVTESDLASSSILVTVASRKDTHGAQNCPAVLAYGTAKITLASPITGKLLLHARVSPDWVNVLNNS